MKPYKPGEKAAIAAAVSMWKGEVERPAALPGFSGEEAAEILELPLERVWRWLGGSVWYERPDGCTEMLFSETDLFVNLLLDELESAGVPPLVLAIVMRDFASEIDNPLPNGMTLFDGAIKSPVRGAYPLTVELASEWVLEDDLNRSADRSLWPDREELVDPERRERNNAAVRAAVDAGRAVLVDEAEVAGRVKKRLHAWRSNPKR